MVAGGYAAITDALAAGLDVRVSTPVATVESRSGSVVVTSTTSVHNFALVFHTVAV